MSTRYSWLLMTLAVGSLSSLLYAHPADVSHLRVQMKPQSVELRLSLNAATLERITGVPLLSAKDIQAAMPGILTFLRETVQIRVNDTDCTLPEPEDMQFLWPQAEEQAIAPSQTGACYTDLTFQLEVRPWLQDLAISFDWFGRLGDLHATQCVFAQKGKPEAPVEFTVQEPDFLWDTEWTKEILPPPAPRTEPHVWFACFVALLAVAILLHIILLRQSPVA